MIHFIIHQFSKRFDYRSVLDSAEQQTKLHSKNLQTCSKSNFIQVLDCNTGKDNAKTLLQQTHVFPMITVFDDSSLYIDRKWDTIINILLLNWLLFIQ